MKITNAALQALTPEAVKALRPNEILASILFAKISMLTRDVQLIPPDAYKIAVAKVKTQLDPDGGLKPEAYEAASDKMKELAKGVKTATAERNTSDKLIALAAVLSVRPAVQIPNELRGYLPQVDKEKGGFKEATYEKYERYPGFKTAAKELRESFKKNPPKKAAPAPAKKDREPSM